MRNLNDIIAAARAETGHRTRAKRLPLPPRDHLKARFDYRGDGKLIWRPIEIIANPRVQASWNARFAGTAAGTKAVAGRYSIISLEGVCYQTHRLVWAWHHGDPHWLEVDHINRCKWDNRIENLRLADVYQQSANTPARGGVYRGVYKRRDTGFWHAEIRSRGVKHSLGDYDDAIDAARAYDEAAREMHGSFAVLNFPGDNTPPPPKPIGRRGRSVLIKGVRYPSVSAAARSIGVSRTAVRRMIDTNDGFAVTTAKLKARKSY